MVNIVTTRLAPVLAVAALLLTPSIATAKVFPNCKAVDDVYPHGIAKNVHAATHATGLTGRPIVSAKLYAQNSTKDRDHDGVACEH